MFSVLAAAGGGIGLQRTTVNSQPHRRTAAGVAPRRAQLSTGGRQQLPTRAEAGGSSSNQGGVSGDASSPIPWTQELVDKLLRTVAKLGGPHKATPWAVLEAVKWPGLSETQVAGFLQTLGAQEQALGAAGAVESRKNGGSGSGGRRETSKDPGNGEPSRLHKLVEEGRLEELQRLLQQGCDLGSEDSEGMTPLHLAAKSGNIDCIRLLVQHGADVEARGSYGYNPLQIAAFHGQGAACKELITLGASLGRRDSRGYTALVVAAMGDVRGEGVRALVQLGASPNERDPRTGATPLHAAAHSGAVGADCALLELGADIEAVAASGIRPLHAAAIGDVPETLAVAQLLVQAGADVSARDNGGRTPLHWAAMRGKLAFMHLLLSAGADHEARDGGGFTPVQLAAQAGKAQARALLSEAKAQSFHNGATLAGTPKRAVLPVNGYTAVTKLPQAAMSLDELCTLLQQGLNPDTLADRTWPLLHKAAEAGALGPIRMLVHYGATLEYQDKTSGQTPLHVAAGLRQPAACRELVALGADLDAPDNRGRTPLMLAAPLDESGDCVRVLIQAGANIKCMDAMTLWALDHAVMAGMLAPAKVLLEAGAAAPGSTRAETTPLHLTALSSSPNAAAMVRLLLGAGMAVSAVDGCGITPLHAAAMEGNAEVARVLLQAGARPDAHDNEGSTPAQLAAERGHVEVELLLRQAM